MKRKCLLALLIVLICFFTYAINSVHLKFLFGILKINNSLPTISSNFYNDPIDNITYKDIIYKKRGRLDLKLDIYSSTSSNKPSPVIIYVFGNGWMYGDKTIPNGILPIIELLNEEGYTIISTSYELMDNEVILEEQITDIKDTIRWIYKNKDIYNFDVNNIGMIGPSAGAQLSMVAAFSNSSEFIGDKELSKYPSKVDYIIDLFGPAILDKINLSEGPPEIIDKFTTNHIESLSNKYSPINYLKEDLPDTLVIHSLNDNIVPYDTSVEFYNKAILYNNDFEFYTLNECTHYLENLSNIEALNLYMTIIDYIISKTNN